MEVTAPRVEDPAPASAGVLPRGTSLLAALLFVSANTMVLAGLLTAWFVTKGATRAWPPEGVTVDTYIPTIVAVTAAMGAVAVQWAVWAIRRNDQRSATVALVLTVALGLAMLNVEWYELSRASFGLADHAYGTLYYLILGYHLVVVAIGLVSLVVVGARILAGHLGSPDYDAVRAAATTWQYVNASWLFIGLALFVFSPHG